jgi:fructose-1,6-bisphosphatase
MTSSNGEVILEKEDMWDIEDFKDFTKWSNSYIHALTAKGKIPYIKGRPNRYIAAEVKKAILNLQQGGVFGKRKKATKKTNKSAASQQAGGVR